MAPGKEFVAQLLRIPESLDGAIWGFALAAETLQSIAADDILDFDRAAAARLCICPLA